MGRSGKAIDQGCAIEQKPRRQGTEHKILQARFRGLGIIPAKGSQHIEGQRLQLNADIERNQIARRNHHAHANRSQQDQDRELKALIIDPAKPAITQQYGHWADQINRHLGKPRCAIGNKAARKRCAIGADGGKGGGGEQGQTCANRNLAHALFAAKRAINQQEQGCACQEYLRPGKD